MSTIRRTKAALFAPISMQLLQNSSLGFDVRGMLGYLLSKPTGWEIQASDIEREGGIGRDARRRLMREAEIAGYLTFYTERDAQGKLRSGYELHEIPVPEDQRTRQLGSDTGGGLSVAGSPAAGSAVAGKPTPLESIDVQSIDIENKEVVVVPAESVQATTTTTTGELPAEIYARIAGRLLAIREIELIEAKVPDSEAKAFEEWLTGWAATYGTKAVFKVLEAYNDHKSNRRTTRPAGQLVGVSNGHVVAEGINRDITASFGDLSPALDAGAGAASPGDVDADAQRRRRDEADAAHRAQIRARVEAFTRAQQAAHAGSCGVHPSAAASGNEVVAPF